jgi:hypothetical protein
MVNNSLRYSTILSLKSVQSATVCDSQCNAALDNNISGVSWLDYILIRVTWSDGQKSSKINRSKSEVNWLLSNDKHRVSKYDSVVHGYAIYQLKWLKIDSVLVKPALRQSRTSEASTPRTLYLSLRLIPLPNYTKSNINTRNKCQTNKM